MSQNEVIMLKIDQNCLELIDFGKKPIAFRVSTVIFRDMHMCFSILVFAVGISPSFWSSGTVPEVSPDNMFFRGPIWRSKCPYPPHGCKICLPPMATLVRVIRGAFLEGRLFLLCSNMKIVVAAI